MRPFHPYFSIVRKRNSDEMIVGYSIHVRILTDDWAFDFVNPVPAAADISPPGKFRFAAVKYQIKIDKIRPSLAQKQHRQRPSILECEFDVTDEVFKILRDPTKDRPYIHIELCDVSENECSEDPHTIGRGTGHVSSSSGHHEDDED